MAKLTLTLKYADIDGFICFEKPPRTYMQRLEQIIDLCKKKKNGYMTVDFSTPRKPRTTGDKSQNNLFWKLATIIAEETGNDLQDVEDGVKERALKRGYPYDVNKISGSIKPYSMTRVDTIQMSYLIDECYQVIAELGIILPDKEELQR